MTLGLARPDPLVEQYLRASRADNTLRAYESDLRHFAAWGGTIPSTADQIVRYLAHHGSTLKPSTLRRHLAAIASAHSDMGLADPTKAPIVARVVQGIQRSHGNKPAKVAPLLIDDISRIIARMGTTPRDLRDRLVLLVGFFGAMRRSEIIDLDWADVEWNQAKVKIVMRKSKTDQLGIGREVVLQRRTDELCPLHALRTWRTASGRQDGAVFIQLGKSRSRLDARTVARIVQSRAAKAGLDELHYSGHSLRAGFVTTAALAKFDANVIALQTGHRSLQTLSTYVRAVAFPGLPAQTTLPICP